MLNHQPIRFNARHSGVVISPGFQHIYIYADYLCYEYFFLFDQHNVAKAWRFLQAKRLWTLTISACIHIWCIYLHAGFLGSFLFDVSYIQQEVVADDFFLLFKLFGKDTELSNLCVRIALSIYLFHPISLMLRIRRLRNGWRGWSGASIWACLSCSLPRLCMAGPQNQSCRKRRKGCMNMSPTCTVQYHPTISQQLEIYIIY